MERVLKLLMSLLFPRWHPKAEKQRGKMTLFHVMALNNVSKASIRPVGRGVMGLKKGASGYGNILYQANYNPGSLFSIKKAHLLCEEEARTRYHFEVLFFDNGGWAHRVSVACPRCNDYWTWKEALENDLSQEAGRLCPECLSKLHQTDRTSHGHSQAE